MKNIGATTDIIKEGVVTITTGRRTSMADSKCLAHRKNINNIGTYDITTKVRRMIDIRSHARTNNHPGIP